VEGAGRVGIQVRLEIVHHNDIHPITDAPDDTMEKLDPLGAEPRIHIMDIDAPYPHVVCLWQTIDLVKQSK
jgi:hypothetical protein